MRAEQESTPGLAVLGRAFLAAIPLLWLTAYLTRPLWIDAPSEDGLPAHPLSITFFVLSLSIGAVTPCLLLPVGPAGGCTVEPSGVLVVPTVLGRRRLELDRLMRVGALTLVGGGPIAPDVVCLRYGRFRWVVVALGVSPRLTSPLRGIVERAADERPEIFSARARTLLKVGSRPGFPQRLALGTVSFVLGMAAYGAWLCLAWAFVLVGWMPHS
ncbi:hypothetical protein J4G33_08080 [Actinotalea sp. BY-33]|uniref:Uncharacterized protein n=1 Tax=Actinotalea soli TaxID=2819234 RepID=A0A939LPA8_9CELL|nr:hypothetical protein [Actinotalea soli]MBO1751756.1 hypothetical protein [Actinotalea soli]